MQYGFVSCCNIYVITKGDFFEFFVVFFDEAHQLGISSTLTGCHRIFFFDRELKAMSHHLRQSSVNLCWRGAVTTRSTACHGMRIYGSAFVICCERGVWGSLVPNSVTDIMQKAGFTPKVIKFAASGHYLITDGIQNYWYWM